MVRKISLFLLIFFLLFFPLSVLAQSNASLASVLVELWPEFDRPTMLVIYHIKFSTSVMSPRKMELRIPDTAGEPHAVAARQPDGSLVTIPYEKKSENDWSRIIFQTNSTEIQLEFYDPTLEKHAAERNYVYTWPGDFAVNELILDVQKPIGAENLQIIPGMATPEVRPDGMTYYHTNVGPLSKGQSFEIKIKYLKANDDLSIGSLSVAPSAPLDTSTTGAISITSMLPWFLGFIGLALIIGGGIWYWHSGRQKVQPSEETTARGAVPLAEAVTPEDETDRVYCPQCGKRASKGDLYCRICGAPLK